MTVLESDFIVVKCTLLSCGLLQGGSDQFDQCVVIGITMFPVSYQSHKCGIYINHDHAHLTHVTESSDRYFDHDRSYVLVFHLWIRDSNQKTPNVFVLSKCHSRLSEQR